MRLSVGIVFALLSAVLAQAQKPLEIYNIDAEGGKALLVVSPSGESLLFDAGWPGRNGRDANRIVETAKAAGLKQIDYLVISHYDLDHHGDPSQLAALIPVKRLIDNGPFQSQGKGIEERYKAYSAVYDKLEHSTVKPGDKIPIKGLDVTVVTAATKMISAPLPGAGAPNPLCASTPLPDAIPEDLEDNMSIGLLFELGKFRMLDLSDVESHYNQKLMCPNNPIGAVDVYNVNVHAQAKGVTPVLAHALGARAAVVPNGARKGGDPASWPILRSAPGLEDIWQLHFSVAGGKDNNPPENFIANMEAACEGKDIRISARPDGSFTITNGRNGFSKTYSPRK